MENIKQIPRISNGKPKEEMNILAIEKEAWLKNNWMNKKRLRKNIMKKSNTVKYVAQQTVEKWLMKQNTEEIHGSFHFKNIEWPDERDWKIEVKEILLLMI
ncbi:MAG: hypothetical protein Ta2E_11490 [Mycoplasmoidaceae bacterium]|nr:MAG: hypothetical protein Ta2E_11490 [Mycoplasmoidaceae bacterium]